MRRIKVSMHVSLDGFVGGPNGEMNWIKLDGVMFDLIKTFTDEADTALYGRTTWNMMEAYWPTAGDNPGASKHDKEHSAWYKAVDKIVISDSLKGQRKDKTTIIGGDISAQLKGIKQEKGRDILIFGSPSVVRTLIKDQLIDDYWLFVNPVILGKGIPMFPAMDKRIELVPVRTEKFASGVTGLHYKAKS